MTMLAAVGAIAQQGAPVAGWSYYRTVAIDNTGGAAHTDWPVMVSLTSGNFTFANADTNGIDLQFRATDGTTVLDYWREAYDDATDTATLWVKVPSVPADDTVDVRLYYGNHSAVDGSDGVATFPLLFTDFDDPDEFAQGHFSDTDLCYGNYNRYSNPLTTIGGSGSWKEDEASEQSRVLYDPAETDPDRRYKLYYSGLSAVNASGVGVLFSPDGFTWTEYGANPIITGTEDPYVLKVGSTYHLFGENGASSTAILHYTSTDGVSWTQVADALTNSAGVGDFDQNQVGSPGVFIYEGVWYMVYHGVDTDGGEGGTRIQQPGLATSSDGTTWTRSSFHPLPLITAGGSWYEDIVATDVVEGNDGWYVFASAGVNFGRFYTADDPSVWDETSFSEYGTNPVARDGDTLLVENFDGRKVVGVLDSNKISIYDLLGGGDWSFTRRLGFAVNGSENSNLRADRIQIEIGDSALALLPSLTDGGSYSLGATSEGRALTSDFRVMTRRKVDKQGGKDHYNHMSFGYGALQTIDSIDYWAAHANGYFMRGSLGDATNWQMYRVDAGVTTTLGSTFTVSSTDLNNWNVWEFWYRADGSMGLVVNGSTKMTATDTTHDADGKEVALTQGQNAANGGISNYDWIAVRPYDGVDPSTSVGSETAP